MRAGPWQRIIVDHAGNEEMRFGVLKAGCRSDQARIFSLSSRWDGKLGLRTGVWVAVAPHRRNARASAMPSGVGFSRKTGERHLGFPAPVHRNALCCMVRTGLRRPYPPACDSCGTRPFLSEAGKADAQSARLKNAAMSLLSSLGDALRTPPRANGHRL